MASSGIFQFGIEIELLVESPNRKHTKWKDLANDISATLAKEAGITAEVDTAGDYTQWSIVNEVTVQNPGKPYHYGIELISPIYTAASLPALRTTLTDMFNHVPVLIPSTACSSHIHISRASHPLKPVDLAALAKAALYFETALEALMTPFRQSTAASPTYWSQSLRSHTNPSLHGLSLSDCLAKVDAAAEEGTMRSLVEVVNLHSKTTRYAIAKGKTDDFIRGKTYKWDFTGLLSTTSGEREGVLDCGIEDTVEFRQPPGSMNGEEAVGWAVLGVAFVAGVVGAGEWRENAGGEVREEGGSLRELWDLLEKGAGEVGWDDLKAVEELFREARKAV